MTSPGGSDWARSEAVKRARAILAGELDVLYGCVVLAEVADGVVPDWRDDPDFVIFGAVASECDHIPLGPARQQWKGAALARMDAMQWQTISLLRRETMSLRPVTMLLRALAIEVTARTRGVWRDINFEVRRRLAAKQGAH